MKYDIIVIGAGTAGMPCAIEAAKRGKNVLVIEKDNKVGGTLHLTGGHMSGGGTNRQQKLGIDDSVQTHFDDVMRISFNTADADLVQVATTEAPHTLNWLESIGFEFAPESPRLIYGHVPYSTARTHYSPEAGKAILKVLMPLWNEQVALGQITCLLEHRFEDLIIDNQTVIGIKANGQDFFVEDNGSVVITTGGYGGNATYFAQKHPNLPPLKSTANPLCVGEGIQIAEKNGVALWGFDKHIGSLGGIELEPNSGIVDFWTAWAMILTSKYRTTREVYLNVDGKRFMNEDEFNADTRERIVGKQPEQAFFIIFDENALKADGMKIMMNWNEEKIKAEATQNKAIFVANSLEELAQKTGLSSKNLQNSIAQFNDYVNQGNDPDFGRTALQNQISEAPFYAIKTYVSVILTFGGIKVNKHLQVLNTKHQIIKNLYAAGETIGMAATSGNAFCSGMAVTPALSFGRILGKTI